MRDIFPTDTVQACSATSAGAVGIVSSAGGIPALMELMPRLVPLYPVPIVITQHLPHAHSSLMPTMFRLCCNIETDWVTQGERLEAEKIYLVPPGYQLEFVNGRARLFPLDGTSRAWLPSVDAFLHSLSRTYGKGAVGVVLSGVLPVGVSGLRAISDAGGVTIAQHSDSAAFQQMPSAATDLAKAQLVLKPASIAQALNAMVPRWRLPQAA
jgi:chemotaxis response regulator CheB